ncbi:MAG: hypothetical protein AAB092_06745, partial [Chloroflexota bacterium]
DEHRFPSSDPFSWTADGRRWYLHEWLSEVLLYVVQSSIGFSAAVALTAGTIVATLAVVYRLALRACSRELVVLGLVFLAAAMMLEFTKVRPQVFTWLFFAIFVRQLYLSYRGEAVSLWPLPILMAVWSNMHLGYLFGLGTMYIWLICMIFRDQRPSLTSLRAPLVVTGLATLAPVISPLGPRALLVPFDYLGNGSVAFDNIEEWASPDFHILTFAPMIIGIAVLFITGLPLGRKQLFGTALTIVLLAAALVSSRNMPFFAFVMPIVAAESIAQRWPAAKSLPQAGSQALNWAIVTLVVALSLVALPFFGRQLHSDPKVPSDMPPEGVTYIREHPMGGRMFNSYNWGGYLIYELYPDVKVSIDGRSDLYGDGILQQYLDITGLSSRWRDELGELDPNFILLPKSSTLAVALRDEAAWKVAFEGRVEVIFIPAQTP